MHEEEDHSLGTWLEVRNPDAEWIGVRRVEQQRAIAAWTHAHGFLGEQPRQRDGTEPRTTALEHVAPIHRMSDAAETSHDTKGTPEIGASKGSDGQSKTNDASNHGSIEIDEFIGSQQGVTQGPPGMQFRVHGL